MTGAIVATAVVVMVALAVRLAVVAVGSHRGERGGTELSTWTDPATRARPVELDLAGFGLAAPGRGELLGVVFTHPECESCAPLTRRLEGIEALTPAAVDVTVDPDAVRAAGVASVPTLVLVDADGDVVRSWTGTPLAGTVEETVRRSLDA